MSHWLRQDYGFTKEDWYNPYEALNKMPLPPESLYEIQRSMISSELQKSSKSQSIEQINAFIKKLQTDYHELGSEEDFFQVFINTLNQGYAAFDDKQQAKPEPPAFLQEYEINVKKFLNILAQYSDGGVVPDSLLTQLEGMKNRILGGVDSQGNSIEQNFYAFRQRKSDFLEEVATWVYSLAGFNSITSGSFVDKAGKQFLSDTIAYLGDSLLSDPSKNNNNGFINVSLNIRGLRGKGQQSAREGAQNELLAYLKDRFPKQADKISFGEYNWIEIQADPNIQGFQDLINTTQNELGYNISVKFNDTFKQQIEKGIRTQVKSGNKQNLINQNKRNQISQSELIMWDEYLRIAMEFYQNFQYDDKVDSGTSDTLNSYINWTFSRNIMSTALGGNELYLSANGFSTLDQQMEQGDFHFELKPSVDSLKLLSSVQVYDITQVPGH